MLVTPVETNQTEELSCGRTPRLGNSPERARFAKSKDITPCGYSITMNERGKIIRTIAAVRPKLKIRTRVSDGKFGSETL